MKSLTDQFVSLTAKECASLEAMVRTTKLHEGETVDGLLERSLKCMLDNKIEKIANAWKKVCPVEFDETDVTKLPSEQLNAVMSHSIDKGGSLYLHGKAGACKTRIMFLKAALEFAKAEGTLKVHYIPSDEFCIIANNATYRMDAAMKMLDNAKGCDLLLMDDIFKGKLNESQELVIYGITNHRQAHQKSSIYTSNIGIEDIHKAFTADGSGNRSDPVIRRFVEVCKVVKFK